MTEEMNKKVWLKRKEDILCIRNYPELKKKKLSHLELIRAKSQSQKRSRKVKKIKTKLKDTTASQKRKKSPKLKLKAINTTDRSIKSRKVIYKT